MTNRTTQDRDFLAAMGFSIMLTWIAEDPHIELIKKVFLKSTLTPQDIVAEAKKKLHLIGDSSYVIYEHIQYALYRDMKENPDSGVIDAVYQAAWDYCKGKGRIKDYSKLVQTIKSRKYYSIPKGPGIAACMMFFLVYEQVPLPQLERESLYDYAKDFEKQRIHEKSAEKRLSLDKHYFSDLQIVGESNAYASLREKVIAIWVDFLKNRYQVENITHETWPEIVAKNIHIGLYNTEKETYMDEIGSIETGIMESISILGHQSHKFGYDTLLFVMGDAGLRHASLKNYHPDVTELFEISLQAQIEAYFTCNQCRYERSVFREKLPSYIEDNLETLYTNLVNLYYIDCLYKVLEKNRDDYYYNFSWFYDIEKIEEKKPQKTKHTLDEPKKAKSNDGYAMLNAQYELERKRVLEIGKKFAHDLAEKDRVIEARDDEIASLHYQLQLQQEYIKLANSPEEPDVADVVDIGVLYGKRFLFVGKILESYSELKKTFPNSVFMESETANIKSLKVDGVVLLIRNMSHSMYYKVMQNSQLTELPRVYCNSRNINNVYHAMLREMQK